MKEVKDLLKKIKPEHKDNTNALWYSYLLSEDKEYEEEILRLLADQVGENYENIVLPPPNKALLRGDIYIGDVYYGEKLYGAFNLRDEEFIRHLLIVGMTGTGKTNTIFHFLQQLKNKGKPFLILDWKKSYRDLLQFPEFKDTLIFTIGNKTAPFFFNPLIPPLGVNPKEWLAKLIDVIGHAYFTGHGVEYYLRKAVDNLYERIGIYKGNKKWPLFQEVGSLINKEYGKGREMLWLASVKRVLASVNFPGLLGDVVNVRAQGPIEDILHKNVIFELDALADSDKIFFIEALLLWIYKYRKLQPKREIFKHALIIEEAHHVLSRKKEKARGSETVIETIIRMIREFGQSVIVVDQEPSKLSDSIKANTYCKISFNLGNGLDILNIAKCMNLEKEHIDFLDRLKVGEAIIKLKGRFYNSIHVKFPKVKIKKGIINDIIIKNHMKIVYRYPLRV